MVVAEAFVVLLCSQCTCDYDLVAVVFVVCDVFGLGEELLSCAFVLPCFGLVSSNGYDGSVDM